MTIDELIKTREEAKVNLARSTRELFIRGVKIGRNSTGEISLPASFDKYLDKYERSNSEFEWEAEYFDGTILKQYDKTEKCYKDIDQSKLKSISYISNFVYPTDNREKRIVITLDFERGAFTFMNGFCPQEIKWELEKEFKPKEKTLHLLARKRNSFSIGQINVEEELRPWIDIKDEYYMYNRYILGIRSPEGDKIISISPIGDISMER